MKSFPVRDINIWKFHILNKEQVPDLPQPSILSSSKSHLLKRESFYLFSLHIS